MKKRNNNTYKISQKQERKYTQYALFDLEASNSAIPSPATEADHIQSQDSQSIHRESESIVNNEEHDTKAYFTPKEIVHLMVELLDPQPETTIYDPCCSSGTFLIAALRHLEKKYPGRETALFGQELHSDLCAQARTALSHNSNASINICEGNALQKPNLFGEDNRLRRFDYIISNPPWNQEVSSEYFALASNKERFEYGMPKRYADWGWIQHILALLKDQGRAAILMSLGAITRGIYTEDGSEQKIRKAFIQRNYIEAVIRLPDNLFSDVTFPCVLLLLNRNKSAEQQDQILEIDASRLFTAAEERPKKRLMQEGIDTILDVYKYWETRDRLSKVVRIRELKEKRYNLNPSVYNRALPRPVPLEEIRHKLEAVQVKHRHIYIEIAASLNNQHVADLVLSGEFDTAISKIVNSQSPQERSQGITLLRQHIPRLQPIIEQEKELQKEYKRSLMYGFFTDPAYSYERLGEIATISSGRNPSSEDEELYGNEVHWVQVQDLNNGRIESTKKMLSKKGLRLFLDRGKKRDVNTNSEVDITDDSDTTGIIRKKDTVLIAKINGCEEKGKWGILNVPATTNVEVCCIEPRTDDYLPEYLIQYIFYIRHTWADYASQTRNEPRVTNAMIEDTQVVLPLKAEQQEIVNKLQKIDTRISSLESENDMLDTLRNQA